MKGLVTPESSIAKSTTPSSTSTSAPSRTRTSAWPVASWNPSTHTTVNSSLTTTIGKCDHRLVWNQSIGNPEGFRKKLENNLLTNLGATWATFVQAVLLAARLPKWRPTFSRQTWLQWRPSCSHTRWRLPPTSGPLTGRLRSLGSRRSQFAK